MNWRRGKTLMTPTTIGWTEEEIKRNNLIEETMVFSNFYGFDNGKSRRLVCTVNKDHVDYEKNIKLIESAPELYSIIKAIQDMPKEEKKEDGDKTNEENKSSADFIEFFIGID